MAYRFVHAADIHLDSPLRSLALRDPALAELIGNATRRAFVAIVDLCLDEGVDRRPDDADPGIADPLSRSLPFSDRTRP